MTFVDVAAGDDFTLALDTQGRVWSWGGNAYGQLGHGSASEKETTPGLVQYFAGVGAGTVALGTNQFTNDKGALRADKIIAIAANGHYAMALSKYGHLYAWGDNSNHQLGILENDSYVPYAVSVMKGNSPSDLPIMTNVVMVAVGRTTSYALMANGSVFSWGDNTLGQIGDGTSSNGVTVRERAVRVGLGNSPQESNNSEYISQVVSIAAGDGHVLALRVNPDKSSGNGLLYGWGKNDHMQLGSAAASKEDAPVLVRDKVHSMAAGYDSSLVYADYTDTAYTPATIPVLLAYGDNGAGQLGVGSYADVDGALVDLSLIHI